mgnify:FL=1
MLVLPGLLFFRARGDCVGLDRDVEGRGHTTVGDGNRLLACGGGVERANRKLRVVKSDRHFLGLVATLIDGSNLQTGGIELVADGVLDLVGPVTLSEAKVKALKVTV